VPTVELVALAQAAPLGGAELLASEGADAHRDGLYVRLQARADGYAAEALASTTRRAYRGEWRAFVSFCSALGLAPLPAEDETLRIYLGALADKGRRPAGIDVALAAIGHAHTRAGLPSPRSSPAVVDVRRGIRRRLGTAPAPKAALGADELREVVADLPHDALGARDRALLLLGWVGGFRPAELAAVALRDLVFEPRHAPQRILVRIPRSKTDQEGQGLVVKTIPRSAAAESCPVRALLAWLDVRPGGEGPVFLGARFGRAFGSQALSRRDVSRILKRASARAGLDREHVDELAGASLRSGFVTAAVAAGKPLPVIMVQTGHKKPQTLTKYVRRAALEASAAEGLL
jgi:integrase